MGTVTALATTEGSARVISYATTKEDIAALAEQYKDIDARVDFETARLARADLRSRRVAVEARRKDLKAEALEFGRKVDGAAKELTGLIEAIEGPIDTQIKAIEQEAAHAKFQAENAERLARESEAKRIADEEAARKKAEQDAEDARLAEVARLQGIEADRLAEEKAKVEKAARDAKKIQDAAQKKLDDERKAFEKEKAEAARKVEEAERATKRAQPCASCGKSITTDKACGVVHASLQTDDEAVAIAEREAAALRAAKAESLKPDREKLALLGNELRKWFDAAAPENLTTPEAGEALDRAQADIEDIAKRLEAFGS